LSGTLVELSDVRLIGLRVRVVAGDRYVHRIENRDGGVDGAAREEAVSSSAGCVGSAAEEMKSAGALNRDTSARCDIPAAAVAAHPSDLYDGLLKRRPVRLVSGRRSVSSGVRGIERREIRVG
jgi:hypothetical protein